MRQAKALLNFFEISNHLYWVLFDIITFGFLTKSLGQTGNETDIMILLSNLAVWYVVPRGAIFIALPLLKDLSDLSLIGLMSTPLSVFEWLVAQIIMGIIGSIISFFMVFFSVKIFFGYNVFTMVGWLIIPSAALSLFSSWIIGIIILAILLIVGKKAMMTIYPLASFFVLFSGVFYPMETMPPLVQKISHFIPMSYIFYSLRKFFKNGEIFFYPFLKSFGLNIIYFIIALAIFLIVLKQRKKIGLTSLEAEA
jgi:ABC-type multidrug transport system permease subunit